MSWWSFKPYVSVARRRANAAKEIKKLEKKGHKAQPVQLEGKTIARTFWGKAWCNNLEAYSDYANRLPRGRTYVRNGSVCDLQIEPGRITARVCGSSLYKIEIAIKPLAAERWSQIKRQCAGQIGSVIELLQGKLSQSVMQIITRPEEGLFPKPTEIDLDCSCPDWADLCKHVAAALYGVGARLDQNPELLFVLRKVDHFELISAAGDVKAFTQGKTGRKTIAADALADVFGIDLEDAPQMAAASATGQTSKTATLNRSAKSNPSARRRSQDSRSAGATRSKSRPEEKTLRKTASKKRSERLTSRSRLQSTQKDQAV